MAKKNFSKGIEAFFSAEPFDAKEEVEPQDQHLSQKAEKRATFLIEIEQLDKIKALAYWERKILKQVLKEALDKYFIHKGEAKIQEALKNYRKTEMHLSN